VEIRKKRKRKAGLDVCQAGRGESKLDSVPKDLERAKF
jgi:hypothetical protein